MKSSTKISILVLIIVGGGVLGVNASTAYCNRKRPLIDSKILLPSGEMGDISIAKSDMEGTYDIFIRDTKIASIDNSSEESKLNVFSQDDEERTLLAVGSLNTEHPNINIYGDNGVSFELQSSALGGDLQCVLRKTDRQRNIVREFVDQTGDGIFDIKILSNGKVVDCSYWDKVGLKWAENSENESERQ